VIYLLRFFFASSVTLRLVPRTPDLAKDFIPALKASASFSAAVFFLSAIT